MEYDDKLYYRANMQKIHEQLPMLSEKDDTIYRYIKKLCDLWLIEKVPKLDYYRITEKWLEYEFIGNKSDQSEINPNEVGNKSDSQSEINPTYNNTNKDNNIDNNPIEYEADENTFSVIEIWKKGKKMTPPLPPPYFEEVELFINTQAKKIPWVAYQVRTRWAEYYCSNHIDYEKLIKKVEEFSLTRDDLKAILKYVVDDHFRAKNIWSIWKLLKSKDWEPYRVKMLNNMDYPNKSAKKRTVPDMWWWFI